MEIQFLKEEGEDLIVHLQHADHQMHGIYALMLLAERRLLRLLHGLLDLGRIFF